MILRLLQHRIIFTSSKYSCCTRLQTPCRLPPHHQQEFPFPEIGLSSQTTPHRQFPPKDKHTVYPTFQVIIGISHPKRTACHFNRSKRNFLSKRYSIITLLKVTPCLNKCCSFGIERKGYI